MASVTKTITETVDGSGNPSVTTSLYFTSFEDFMEYERVSGTTPNIEVVGDVTMEGRVEKVETMKAPLTELELGKQYRITQNLHGHEFDIGTVVVIVSGADGGGEYKAELLDGSDYWYIRPEEVEEI